MDEFQRFWFAVFAILVLAVIIGLGLAAAVWIALLGVGLA